MLSQFEAQQTGGGVLDMIPVLIKFIWKLVIWAARVEKSYLQVRQVGQLLSGGWRNTSRMLEAKLEASCPVGTDEARKRRLCRSRLDGSVVSEHGGALEAE